MGKRFLLAAIVALSSYVAFAGAVAAQCPPAPSFDIDFTPADRPPRPQLDDEVTYQSLERFRAEVETYRRVSMEGYNTRLIRYGEKLDRIERQARADVAKGTCPQADYDLLKEAIVEEFRKIKEEYSDVYREALGIYEIDIKSYHETLFLCVNGTIDC